jgi:RNA 2',3'-cyclic 3'-phosphodiesterase
VRLFVALAIAAPARREVARRLESLRHRRLPPARWVDPDVLHLTLLFLGEVAEERVADLRQSLATACAPHPPLDLGLSGAGWFPPERPARVLWVGVAAGSELAALQRDVAAAAGDLAPDESRPYHPHVTLARCDPPWPAVEAQRFAAAFAGPLAAPFGVEQAVLVHSRLGKGGARHETIAAFPLAGTP